jgi:hypothetical protein
MSNPPSLNAVSGKKPYGTLISDQVRETWMRQVRLCTPDSAFMRNDLVIALDDRLTAAEQARDQARVALAALLTAITEPVADAGESMESAIAMAVALLASAPPAGAT